MALAEAIVGYRLVMEPGSKDLLVVVGIWNTFNLMLAAVSLGVVAERRERRKTQRMAIQRDAELVIGATIVPVVTVDISAGGVRLRAEDGKVARHIQTGAEAILRIKLRNAAQEVASLPLTLRNRGSDEKGPLFGFEYTGLQARHYLTIANMLLCDASVLERFRDSRRKQKNIFAGVTSMVSFAFSEPARAFSYLLKERETARLAAAKALAEAAPALFKPNLPTPAEIAPAPFAASQLAAMPEVLSPGAALARVHEVMARLQSETDNGAARPARAGGQP